MRDPHVVALRYRFCYADDVTYDNPPAMDAEADSFNLLLQEDLLTVTLKEHFPSVASAKEAVEPILRAWELDVGLRHGPSEISFDYQDADVIDRDPPQPGNGVVAALVGVSASASVGTLKVHITRRNYPQPPGAFVVTPDVETMWRRYAGHQRGREPLLSMANFCLTVVEGRGTRGDAANKFAVSNAILRRLGDLVSNRGDEFSARKYPQHGTYAPLSGAEEVWIDAAVKLLIRRVGEHAAASHGPLVQLTMNDLPPI
jgi:hypothetical protein